MNILGATIPEPYQSILQLEFFGNTVLDYSLALAVLLAIYVALRIFAGVIVLRLESLTSKTGTDIDDALIRIIKDIKAVFYTYISFYISIQFLSIPERLNQIATALLIIISTYQTIRAIGILVEFAGNRITKDEKTGDTESAVAALKLISKIVLWVIGVLLIISNLGINITSLVAGLGIGGVAVALAVQNILGDLLSSFSIYFDKPFRIGDFIVVGEHMGTVEKIGIKSTRIRALQGEEVVIPNQTITETNLQNYKRMKKRRVTFSFGVTYNTPVKKLKKISQKVQEIIEAQDNADFDRAHLFKFGDSALNYEVVYFVKTGDYNQYMDTQQELNIDILKALEKMGVEMAFPTRTIYMQK